MSELQKLISPVQAEPPGHAERYLCTRCGDRGIVRARRAGDKDQALRPEHPPTDAGLYVFRCSCAAGDREKRPYPSWLDVDRTQFEIE
jgi:hypothetical protein